MSIEYINQLEQLPQKSNGHQRDRCVEEFNYVNNSLHLVQEYVETLARGYYLFPEAKGFPRA